MPALPLDIPVHDLPPLTVVVIVRGGDGCTHVIPALGPLKLDGGVALVYDHWWTHNKVILYSWLLLLLLQKILLLQGNWSLKTQLISLLETEWGRDVIHGYQQF